MTEQLYIFEPKTGRVGAVMSSEESTFVKVRWFNSHREVLVNRALCGRVVGTEGEIKTTMSAHGIMFSGAWQNVKRGIFD
jgi:hypothetical protein